MHIEEEASCRKDGQLYNFDILETGKQASLNEVFQIGSHLMALQAAPCEEQFDDMNYFPQRHSLSFFVMDAIENNDDMNWPHL